MQLFMNDYHDVAHQHVAVIGNSVVLYEQGR